MPYCGVHCLWFAFVCFLTTSQPPASCLLPIACFPLHWWIGDVCGVHRCFGHARDKPLGSARTMCDMGVPAPPRGGGEGLKHAERQPRAAAPGAFTSCLQTRGLFAGPGGERHGMRRSDQPLVVSRCRIGILVAFFGGERGAWAYGWGSGQICGGGPDDSCWGW